MTQKSDKFALIHWIHENKVSVESTQSIHDFDLSMHEAESEKIYQVDYTGGKRLEGKHYDAFEGKILHTAEKKVDLKRLEKEIAVAFRNESSTHGTSDKGNHVQSEARNKPQAMQSSSSEILKNAKKLKEEAKHKRLAEISAAKDIASKICGLRNQGTTTPDQQQSVTRNEDRQQSMTRKEDRQQSMTRKEDRQQSMTQNEDRQQSMTRKEDGQQSMTRKEDGQQSMTRNEDRQQSMTRNDGRQQSMTQNDGRQQSMTRNEDRQQSMTQNKDRQQSMTQNDGRQQSMTRNEDRQQSITRNEDRQQSTSTTLFSDLLMIGNQTPKQQQRSVTTTVRTPVIPLESHTGNLYSTGMTEWNYNMPYTQANNSVYETSDALHCANDAIYYEQTYRDTSIAQGLEIEQLKARIKHLEGQLAVPCICRKLKLTNRANVDFLRDLVVAMDQNRNISTEQNRTVPDHRVHAADEEIVAVGTNMTESKKLASTLGTNATKSASTTSTSATKSAHNFANGSSTKVELVPGYGVHIDIRQLDSCERKAKGSPTALVRYLLIVFFSEETMAACSAMGKKTGKDGLDTNIITAIKKHSEQLIQHGTSDNLYVRTEAYEEAENILKRGNILFITGNPGDGKTSLAYQLMKSCCQKENDFRCLKPLILDGRQQCHELVRLNDALCVLIDDVFDCVVTDRSKHWSDVFDLFMSMFQPGKSSSNNVLILTSRKDVFYSCPLVVRSSSIFNEGNTLDLSHKRFMSRHSMCLILQNYLPPSDFERIDEEEFNLIEKYSFKIGFPQCCKVLREHKTLIKMRRLFFQNPYHFLLNELYKISDSEEDKDKYCALLFLLLHPECSNVEDLESDQKAKRIAQCLHNLFDYQWKEHYLRQTLYALRECYVRCEGKMVPSFFHMNQSAQL